MAQGFSRKQAELLYDQIDGTLEKEDEMRVWLQSKSVQSEASNTVHKTLIAWHLAQKNLIEQHGNGRAGMILGYHMAQSLPRMTTTTTLAFTGYYDAAMVLLRTTMEAVLRMTIATVDELSDELKGPIERCEKKWASHSYMMKSHPEGWRGALDDDCNHTISTMSFALGSMHLAKPVDVYVHIEGKNTLNRFTHAKKTVIDASDENPLVQGGSKIFEKEKFEEYARIYQKSAEAILILWQNLLDRTDGYEKPLLVPGDDFEEEDLPQLAKLIRDGRVLKKR